MTTEPKSTTKFFFAQCCWCLHVSPETAAAAGVAAGHGNADAYSIMYIRSSGVNIVQSHPFQRITSKKKRWPQTPEASKNIACGSMIEVVSSDCHSAWHLRWFPNGPKLVPSIKYAICHWAAAKITPCNSGLMTLRLRWCGPTHGQGRVAQRNASLTSFQSLRLAMKAPQKAMQNAMVGASHMVNGASTLPENRRRASRMLADRSSKMTSTTSLGTFLCSFFGRRFGYWSCSILTGHPWLQWHAYVKAIAKLAFHGDIAERVEFLRHPRQNQSKRWESHNLQRVWGVVCTWLKNSWIRRKSLYHRGAALGWTSSTSKRCKVRSVLYSIFLPFVLLGGKWWSIVTSLKPIVGSFCMALDNPRRLALRRVHQPQCRSCWRLLRRCRKSGEGARRVLARAAPQRLGKVVLGN